MSESSLLFKMVVFIGLLMVFISLAYPGANAAWSNLETTIQNPPSLPTFPSFNNPSNAPFNTSLYFAQDNGGSIRKVDPGLVIAGSQGCDSAHVYNCLNNGKFSGNVSFTPSIAETFGIVPRGGGIVGLVHFDVVCRNENHTTTGLAINMTVPGSTTFFSYHFLTICGNNFPAENQWTTNISGSNIPINWFSGALVTISTDGSIGHATDNTTLLYFRVDLYAQGTLPGPSCGALDVACALTGAFNVIAAPFITFFNGVIYVVQVIVTIVIFIGEVFVFLAQILVGVMLGLFASMLYFLNLPGAPSWVQAIVDAIFIGFLIFLALVIVDRAVGIFGGAVNKA